MKVNITDKLSNEKPEIEIKGKCYPINDGIKVVSQFQTLAVQSTEDSLLKAIELTLGKNALKELDISNWSISNFKVLTIGIMAAIEGVAYEEVERRFQK